MHPICLITPGHLSTNPRLVKEADALSGAGYDVSVICGQYMEWGIREDARFATRPWSVAARVPFGPLTPKPLRIKQVLRQRIARAAVAAGVNSDRLREAAWHPATPEIMRAALAVKADLYIARYPAALPAAARAAARHSALYAFDAEDFHQGDLPDGAEHDFERGLVRAIEERYLHEAAYVTAASPGIAAAYSASYGIPTPTTVLNVFPKSEAPDGPTEAGTKKPGPSVYWFSQTIGADRGLECAVEAVARAQSRPHLYLRGNPAVGYRDHLMALAARAGVDDRLHFEPIAPPSEMVRLAASYDVGLVGEIGHSANRQIALTNKQFTYVLAGLPSLVSNVPAHVDLARGLAPAMMIYRVNDADDLARCMDVCLLDPQALAAARARAFALGRERFTWEDQARKLLNVVEAALSADKGRGRGQTTCASR